MSINKTWSDAELLALPSTLKEEGMSEKELLAYRRKRLYCKQYHSRADFSVVEKLTTTPEGYDPSKHAALKEADFVSYKAYCEHKIELLEKELNFWETQKLLGKHRTTENNSDALNKAMKLIAAFKRDGKTDAEIEAMMS